MGLEISLQKTFQNKYTLEEVEQLNGKTIYYDIKTFDIIALASLNLEDYVFERPQESYIEISIDKINYIEVRGKVYEDKVMKKEFSFVKGRVDEKRDIVD